MTKYTTDTLFNSQSREDVLNCIKTGIDINVSDKCGRNALFFCNNVDAVKAMIEAGIDLNLTDFIGYNALFCNSSPQVLELLIQSGVNIQHRNHDGRSCLHLQQDNTECAEILINAGADIHCVDNEGQTVLYRHICDQAFDYWIDKGCDINHIDYNGNPILDLSATHGVGTYNFNVNTLIRHVDKIDRAPVIIRHASYHTSDLINFLHQRGLNVLFAEHCTLELNVKDMTSFFTELKTHCDISHTQFYKYYGKEHIGACTGIEMVKWFIRNGIRMDDDILRQRADASKVFDYIAGREKKGLLRIMKPEKKCASVRKRL